MYYATGWPKVLNINRPATNENDPTSGDTPLSSSDVLLVLADQQREIFLILTSTSLHLWHSRPIVEIVCHERSTESIEKCGYNKLAAWRPDSSTIVISTTQDHILFYEIRQRLPNNNAGSFLLSRTLSCEDVIYKLKDRTPGSQTLGRTLGPGSSETDPVPALMLFLFGKLDLSSIGVSALMAADEELIVASRTRSDIYGVLWDGSVDEHFPWSLRDTSLASQGSVVVDIKYSSILSGFALVLSNGVAAFMPTALSSPESSTSSEEPDNNAAKSIVIEIPEITDAVCASMNHKYKLIAFGLRSSKAIVCNIANDASSTQPIVSVNHELILPSNRYPHIASKMGEICCIEYTPDQTACVTAWRHGGFAVWSVFGSLLTCSHSWDPAPNPMPLSSMAWGRHGYNLWVSSRSTDKNNSQGEVAVMSFVKSALTSNPDLSCSTETIMLIGDDRLYIDITLPLAPSVTIVGGQESAIAQQFMTIEFPVTYLSANWPIRYASIDKPTKQIAIAGRSGIAMYSIVLRRWKIFNNESQERDFEVCGGLIWWSSQYVIVSCYNLSTQQFEIRAYPVNRKLDTNNATIMIVPDEVILMSVLDNKLLLLDVKGVIKLYALSQVGQMDGLPQNATFDSNELIFSYVRHISLANFIVDLDHVSSLALTRIHLENSRSDDSVLINVSGKLLLIESEYNGELSIPENRETPFKVDDQEEIDSDALNDTCRISMLATNVENFWVSSDVAGTRHEKPYLTQSLWVHRGCSGLEVWLPLLTDSAPSPPHQYMPERIMLSVNLGASFYPLSIMFHDAIALSAENDTMRGAPTVCSCPYQTVSKKSQVYLHHILRELLTRNLGFHAWDLARQHELLPYFAHSFELLLHEVLEAEATSAQPLTDPLLPMIVKFISDFPVYLETVVHCARKTDVALWPHLFSVVGNPRRLFQRCLTDNKLDIAASCIIILHTFERNNVTQQMVAQLLDAARADKRYHYLLDDLDSFMARLSISPDTATNSSPGSSFGGTHDEHNNSNHNQKDSTLAIDDGTI